MQVARPTLPLLNIELAQRKPLHHSLILLNKANDVSTAEASSVGIDLIPPSPLSPPTFCSAKVPSISPVVNGTAAAVATVAAAPPTEFLLLNGRYLLLEAIESAVSSQSQPLRRCIDTVTEETLFCRECAPSPVTATLLQAHHRLRNSQVVTPIDDIIYANGGDAISNNTNNNNNSIYLLSSPSYGDLHSYLRSKRRLKESEARHLFQQAAQAVYDCHSHGVILTDLKLRRFVFADPQRTKLRLESLEEAVVLEQSDSDDGVWRKHGYPAYVTPEVLLSRGARYSGRAADLWSLGIILYTLLVGRYPFQDAGPFGLFTKIIRGHFTVPDFVSSRARCLIRHLLRRDPNQRLEASDILLHPWFKASLRTAKVDQVKSKPEGGGGGAGSTTSGFGAARAEVSIVDQVVPETPTNSQMED